MIPQRLTKRIFSNFNKNSRALIRWFIEAEKDTAEIKIPKEQFLNRDTFRESVKEQKRVKEDKMKVSGQRKNIAKR